MWSGGVYGTWWGLRHQIAAGLNFALSGYDHFDANPASQEFTLAGSSMASSARSFALTDTGRKRDVGLRPRLSHATGLRTSALPAVALRLLAPLHWDDAARTLTIGARQGSYPGMNPGHTFNVVIVAAGHGVGAEPTQAPDKAVQYTGEKITARF